MVEDYVRVIAGRSSKALLVTQKNVDISTSIVGHVEGIQTMPDMIDFCKHSFQKEFFQKVCGD